jgi:hypothetical protein
VAKRQLENSVESVDLRPESPFQASFLNSVLQGRAFELFQVPGVHGARLQALAYPSNRAENALEPPHSPRASNGNSKTFAYALVLCWEKRTRIDRAVNRIVVDCMS